MKLREEHRALLIVLALVAFFVFVSTRSSLWDRDEPRYAQAAVEMARGGDWLVPHFGGEERLHKPAGIYWLMAASIELFGVREASVRIVGPLGALLTALATWRIARRLFDASVATSALIVLLLTPMVFGVGTIATTDAVLCAAITFAFANVAAMLVDGPRPNSVVGLALALGAAQLVKGPVGLTLPLLGIVATWLGLRRTATMSRRFWIGALIAIAGSIALFLAWAIPANAATEGRFAAEGLGHHVVDRIEAPMEGHGASSALSYLYYVPVVLLGFLPWTLQLFGAFAFLASKRYELRARALLAGWAVSTFLFMTVVATKLPHYVLPLFPALSIAIAACVHAAERGELDERTTRWLARGVWLFAPLATLVVAACAVGAWRAPSTGLRIASAALALALAFVGALAVREHVRREWRASARASATWIAIVYIAAAALVLPALEPFKLSPRIAALIRERTNESVTVATYKFDEPSLLFYVGRLPQERLGDAEDLARWFASSDPGVLVAPRSSLASFLAAHPSLRSRELGSIEGFNYSKGKWLELVALERQESARPR